MEPRASTHNSRVTPSVLPPSRLERGVAAALLLALAVGCFFVLRPFVAAILWGAILAFATWPVFGLVKRRLHLGRSAAALLMVVAAFLVMLAPLFLVVADVADGAKQLVKAGKDILAAGLPGPPDWIASIPFAGARIDEQWRHLATEEQDIQVLLAPYAAAMGRWGLDKGVNVGIVLAQGALELALALFVAFFFYRDGAALAARARDGLSRLLGDSGPRLLSVAGNTVKSVVYGVLGTALIQAMLMLVGLLIAGVPNAVLLAFVTGITSPLPIGPPIVWLGAAAWLYATAGWGWAVFMLAWGAGLVSMADNVVRPLLISRGGTTPIVVTLLGILGGVIAFGFLGLFLGPTLLAVGYSLVSEWTARHPAAERQKQA